MQATSKSISGTQTYPDTLHVPLDKVDEPISCLFSAEKQEVHSSAPLGWNGAEPAIGRADSGGVAEVRAGLCRAGVVRCSALVPQHDQAELHLRSGPAWRRGTVCTVQHQVPQFHDGFL